MQDPNFILELSQSSESLHKSIWPPTSSEIAGYFIMFLMSALSNAAGLGGGTVMIPAFVVLFYFETHTAVPLGIRWSNWRSSTEATKQAPYTR
jgi:hypothetical protein